MDILDELDKTIKDKRNEWDYTPKREKSETDALIDQLLLEFSSESKPGEPIRKMKSYSSQYNVKPERAERLEYEQPKPHFPEPAVEVIPVPEPDPISEPEFDTIYDPDKDNEPEFDTIYEPEKDDVPKTPYQPKHEAPPKESEPEFDTIYEPEKDTEHTQIFSRDDIELEKERFENAGYSMPDSDLIGGYDNNIPTNNGGVSGGFDDDYYDENDFEEELGNLSPEDIDESDRDEFEEFIGGENEDQIRVIKPKEKKNTGRKILRILLRAVIAAFTIIGIFSSVIFCLEKLEMMPTEKEEQEESLSDELADVIQPFVMTSVDDFDSADKISNEQLINLAIWEIVIHGDVKFFKDEETSKIVIPQKQVELAAENLVGETKEIEHKDIAFSGLEIKYESEKEGYILPDNYYVLTAYPEVTGVTEQDGTYAINVSCYRDTPHWMSNKKSNPVKKMTFTLKKTEGHYQVLSAITV